MKLNIQKTKSGYSLAFVLILGAFLVFCPFYSGPVVLAEDDVEDLNQDVSERQKEINELEKQVSTIEDEIAKKQQEEKSLNNQISVLDGEIKKTETKIQETELKIDTTKKEITVKEGEIKQKEAEINKQKEVLAEFIRIMYQQDQKSTAEMMFSNGSFSDYLNEMQNTETLENKGQEILEAVKQLKQDLAWQKQVLEAKRDSLQGLSDKLDISKSNLDEEKENKQQILGETQAQEDKYQALLEKARKEQESINVEIRDLEREIRKQLANRHEESDNQWDQIKGDGTLSWPVNPYKGISAYFMDPSYYSYFGVNHYAIDIPTSQGTPMYAPADGYVVRYRDAGYGYSYIMLMHANDLSTVYGHTSASFVSAGQYVTKGQVIGLSGGTPGTKGAGLMTTGPHLHLEVRVNGVPVDPLRYLPGL
ncbi:peptidoglycan DD-metalloendopeptidase family protein [Patescibacteria group bacterium]|nr:peptidoglycan DD-metalloendopeptidase family protein [Patescibacteria group bacterium]